MQNSIYIFLAPLAKLLIGLELFNLFVFILEFLQTQIYAANNIGSFLGQLFL